METTSNSAKEGDRFRSLTRFEAIEEKGFGLPGTVVGYQGEERKSRGSSA